MAWKHGPAPKDRPIFVRSAACVSVATWSDKWSGWLAHADGFDARDKNGDFIVIDAPDYWCDIPDVSTE